MTDMEYRIRSAIFGHAVADALGVPAEFSTREELDNAPIEDMEGFGTYPYPAGAWSDDTSMTLCELDVLADGTIDWDKIMANFGVWLSEGEYTSVGECFDAGRTCISAIVKYFSKNTPVFENGEDDEFSNGNGSLMRILPFILFAHYSGYNGDFYELIHNASSLTHAHEVSKIGCGIYASVARELLNMPSKHSIYLGLAISAEKYKENEAFNRYKRIFDKDFSNLPRDEIKSTGYVVDTLEAALWCLITTDNYKDCVLKAVNLGEDTDTVAAVAGGLAGILYGYDSIPTEWLDTLMKSDYIGEMCHRASKKWSEVS